MAAYSGHAESLDTLLKKGADYEAVDKNDKTAVYLAAEEDKLEALKVTATGVNRCIQVDHRGGLTRGPDGNVYRQVYTGVYR